MSFGEKRPRVAATSCMRTGGAGGADSLWLVAALVHGVTCSVESFAGHSMVVNEHIVEAPRRHVWTDEQLTCPNVRAWLSRAAARLGKRVPHDGTYVYKLLARNAYVVSGVDAVYAVGKLLPDGNVEGGTGWTCALFVTQSTQTQSSSARMYLFETSRNVWMQWNDDGDGGTSWTVIRDDGGLPPSPTSFPLWAGVGSRVVTTRAAEEIRRVFRDTIVDPRETRSCEDIGS